MSRDVHRAGSGARRGPALTIRVSPPGRTVRSVGRAAGSARRAVVREAARGEPCDLTVFRDTSDLVEVGVTDNEIGGGTRNFPRLMVILGRGSCSEAPWGTHLPRRLDCRAVRSDSSPPSRTCQTAPAPPQRGPSHFAHIPSTPTRRVLLFRRPGTAAGQRPTGVVGRPQAAFTPRRPQAWSVALVAGHRSGEGRGGAGSPVSRQRCRCPGTPSGGARGPGSSHPLPDVRSGRRRGGASGGRRGGGRHR